jgi:Immunity protein 26
MRKSAGWLLGACVVCGPSAAKTEPANTQQAQRQGEATEIRRVDERPRSSASIVQRRREIVGVIYRIALGDGYFAYAQALHEADFAVFDVRDQGHAVAREVIAAPVLFRVAVHHSAWSGERWQPLATAPLQDALAKPAPKFIQDPIDPRQVWISLAGERRRASREECAGLERSAVWNPEHVEDRIRDHYAGTANKWVDSMRLK